MTHPEEVIRPKGRLKASPSEWAERVEQWRSSGLSQSEFCRREGLALTTFNRKAAALVGEPVGSGVAAEPREEPPHWLEVRMSGQRSGRVGESSGSLGEGFEVALDGGWRVRLGPQFDAEGLRRLLGVLESLPC
jgi:hypothetical protein